MVYIDEHVKAHLAQYPMGRTFNQLRSDLRMDARDLRASLQRLETIGGARQFQSPATHRITWRVGCV